jgi:nucleoside phosphorylase
VEVVHHCPLMVGIAGAVPHPLKAEDHVRLGDIVVSDRNGVVQYDYVKITEKFKEFRSPPRPPSRVLTDAIRWLRSEEEAGQCPWEKFLDAGLKGLGPRFHRPPDDQDILQDDPAAPPVTHPSDPMRTKPGFPRVFHGTIACSNALLKDSRLRDQIREEFQVKAVEMEGSGVADATWHDEMAGYLVIRGTCDYCNQGKNNDWQRYAALIAAAFARAVVECTVVSKKPDAAEVGTELAAVKKELRSIRKSIPLIQSGGTALKPEKKGREQKSEQPSLQATPAPESHRSVLRAAELVTSIRRSLGEYDYAKARELGRELETIVESTQRTGIPPETLIQCYKALHDVEIAMMAPQEDASSPHGTRARDFLERARNVPRT